MWIVRLALRRPYTFTVVAILILIMGMLAIFRTPTDIFPNINIPVVSIIWNYNGLVPRGDERPHRQCHRTALTTTVDNIEHVESQSLYGIAVVKVFLQPNANMQQAIAQITAISQTQLRQLPAGTTPPLILTYSASSVARSSVRSDWRDCLEQQLNDYGLNFVHSLSHRGGVISTLSPLAVTTHSDGSLNPRRCSRRASRGSMRSMRSGPKLILPTDHQNRSHNMTSTFPMQRRRQSDPEPDPDQNHGYHDYIWDVAGGDGAPRRRWSGQTASNHPRPSKRQAMRQP